MEAIAQAHDHLFKLLLEEEGVADALLRERLPAALAVRLAEVEPEPIPESFVGPELRESRSDRRFRLRLRGAEGAWAQCVVEHKSALDAGIGLQLLGYLTAAYQQLGGEAANRRTLPLIVALVVYHGRLRWSSPRRFSDELAVEEALLPLALDFPIELFDVGRGNPAALSANPKLRGGLKLMRYACHFPEADPVPALVSLLEDLRGMSDRYLEGAGAYLYQYFNEVRLEELRMAIHQVMPEKEEQMLSRAVRETLEQGRAEERAALLLRLIERLYGTPPPEVVQRIRQTPYDQLALLFDRALQSKSLEELFGEPAP